MDVSVRKDYAARQVTFELPIPAMAFEPSVRDRVASGTFLSADINEDKLCLRFADGSSEEFFERTCEETIAGIKAALEDCFEGEVFIKYESAA